MMTAAKWEIVPLKGRYCSKCVEALRDFRLAIYSVLPMCVEDMEQFMHNGDREIVEKLIVEHSARETRKIITQDREVTMLQHIDENHVNDASGNPAGGSTNGTGIKIDWQNGPLGRGAERKEANGAFVEGVIQAAIGRLNYYQSSAFKCRENAIALTHLETALLWLQKRTMDREARAVEGTHSV